MSDEIQFGKERQASSIDYPEQAKASKYDALVEKVLKLPVGKAVVVDCPEDQDSVDFRNNVSAAVRRKLPDRLKGKIFCRITVEGDVSVSREK